jgi:tellurite resistance protein TerA
MGLFGLGNKSNNSTPEPVATPAPAAKLDLGKKSGSINLTKGSIVTIEKTPVIKARTTWSSSTDYDLYALVLLRDGTQKYVSTFGSKDDRKPTMSILNGAVRHLGDVGRGAAGLAEEIIEIKLTDEIEAVVPIAYSAQSNGTGSFKQYQVSLSIDNNAGTEVTVDASNANSGKTIYTVAIGIIRNTPNGVVIEHLEAYSKPGSENRPAFVKGVLTMDAGAKNLYK